jgi:hypothetical protein
MSPCPDIGWDGVSLSFGLRWLWATILLDLCLPRSCNYRYGPLYLACFAYFYTKPFYWFVSALCILKLHIPCYIYCKNIVCCGS